MGYFEELMQDLYLYAIVIQFFPALIHDFFVRNTHRFMRFISPYITIKFPEHTSSNFYAKSEVYLAIQTYLTEHANMLTDKA